MTASARLSGALAAVADGATSRMTWCSTCSQAPCWHVHVEHGPITIRLSVPSEHVARAMAVAMLRAGLEEMGTP